MKNCNFCIHENKVFDLNGYEILPDEDGIVCVFLNGMERRFKIDKMIVWLKESGYKSLFRKPKELPKIKEPKPIIEKNVKVKKERILKVKKPPRVKKQPNLCECGSVMFGKVSCQKCRTANKKPQYKKVEFDKRKVKGKQNDYGYQKRKIECSNGNAYNSLYEASNDTGVTRSQIWHVCNGKWKHTHGLIFQYVFV